MGRLVALAAKRHGRKVGRIRLHENPLRRQALHDLGQFRGVLVRQRAVDAEVPVTLQKLRRHLPAARIAVQHAAHPPPLRLEKLQHVAVRLAVVDADGQIELAREIELAHEDRALQRALLLVLLPVVVEADLADGDDLLLRCPRGEPIVVGRRHRLRFFRMDADRGVDRLESFGERDAARRGSEVVPHRDDLHDAIRAGTRDDLFPVRIKLLAVEMRMRVDQLHHFTLLPAGAAGSTSCSPPSLAAQSSIPCERMPRILAGFRFATRTTFLPTSSSAA